MNQEFSSYGFWFCRIIGWGYPVIIILFLLGLTVKSWKKETINLLVTINVLLIISCVIGLFQIINAALRSHSYPEYDWFAFRVNGNFSFSAYCTVLVANTISVLLLLFPQFRRSWPFSFYILLLSRLDMVELWLTKIFRDHVPSSWQAVDDRYWSDKIIAALIFTASVALIYTVLASINALPFTSSLNFIRRTKNVQ